MTLLRTLPEGRVRRGVQNLLRTLQRILFESAQRLGLHVTPNSFFSPVPDTRCLPEELWVGERVLPGIDLRAAAQVELLGRAAGYAAEVEALSDQHGGPLGYCLENPKFGTIDAHIAYALVREHRPRRIVEGGSGWSTLLLLAALEANAADGHRGELVACEPYPDDRLVLAARRGRVRLEARPLQTLPLSLFTALSAGDVVFIDSTHVLKIGSDVQYVILEILPRLPVGVLVHFHDIFLPQEHPKDWVLRRHRFYNEQYVLEAFLSFSNAYEVLWGASYMHLHHPRPARGGGPVV